MGEAFKHVLEFFKQKVSVWISLALALTVFLFLPVDKAKQLGILELRQKYTGYAACALILIVSLVVVHSIGKLIKYLSKKKADSEEKARVLEAKQEATKYLHKLSPAEKQILCLYILQQEKTQYFSIQDGNVSGLCAKLILYRSSSVGNLYGKGFAFNIQEWAWDYLREHPELITEGVPLGPDGGIERYRNPHNLFGDI